ncbi:hypothetical protein [Hugenholtzia roseola]|uniref:hypothetical protein n=1 Tax=Hugenholtzia roseola TaxID=1002 RepID=UPI0003FD6D2B|nr:hypothetical protein [Hugenholtzia roseola]
MKYLYVLLLWVFILPLAAQITRSSLYIKPIIGWEEGFWQHIKEPTPHPALQRDSYNYAARVPTFGLELGYQIDSIYQVSMGIYQGVGREGYGFHIPPERFTVGYRNPVEHYYIAGEARLWKSSRRVMQTNLFQLSALFGASLCRRQPKVEDTDTEMGLNWLFYTEVVEKRWGAALHAGLTFRLLTEKTQQEMLGISLIFRQGLNRIYRNNYVLTDFTTNQTYQTYSYTRGTTISLQLSYPIRFIKFKK